ncbi:putative AMP-binding enzyme C-terminal domain [Lyophyllum shimeji]|uniref:AMP-binding enzyme C-terminal domain n=1 Tax=Lyophyllum shimeji TaxID=47721 RepID=A0A9P3PPS0_LYOSH|nr:putative AMP-binding enzyme C-terminal domain [Lyophyllum shimeji]
MALPRIALPLRRVSSLANRLPARRCLTHSAVEGPLHPPLETRTLGKYFESEIVRNFPTRPALICRSELPRAHHGPPSRNLGVTTHLAWDFAEFDQHINALARGLLNMGVRTGDRVGVVMGNNSAYAMLQWACAHIGAILVTLNPAYRANELVSTLKLVGVKHLFVVPRIRSSAYIEMLAGILPGLKESKPGEIEVEGLPELRNLVVVDNKGEYQAQLDKLGVRSTIDWREIFMWREDTRERDLQRDISASLKKDDVINLQFTSGTTGAPKAVSLTHSNLLNNGLSIGRRMYLTEKDILCNVPPLFHCFGLVLGNLAAWSHGACIVYPSEVFDPPAIVDAVVAERCTALHGVPTHFLGVLAEFDRRKAANETVDTNSLRTGIAAGSPIPICLMKNLIEKLNLRDLTNAYGMTETSPVSFQTSPADDIIKRVETVGKVQEHVKAKIIDKQGNVVPVGTPGELCVAGYLLQKGYWGDEDQTREVMKTDKEGTLWMHTGDEGVMDEEGYLRIVGRIKDIIIRGGENLFPVQIENALTAQESILEAAAVAVPDEKYGEVVGAWIARRPDTSVSREGIREAVAKDMNPQNAPTWIWFLGEDGVPPELPKTASGKVMKHVLRKWSNDLAEKGVGRVARR